MIQHRAELWISLLQDVLKAECLCGINFYLEKIIEEKCKRALKLKNSVSGSL